MEAADKLREVINSILSAVCSLMFALMVIIGTYQIVTRYVFNSHPLGPDHGFVEENHGHEHAEQEAERRERIHLAEGETAQHVHPLQRAYDTAQAGSDEPPVGKDAVAEKSPGPAEGAHLLGRHFKERLGTAHQYSLRDR